MIKKRFHKNIFFMIFFLLFSFSVYFLPAASLPETHCGKAVDQDAERPENDTKSISLENKKDKIMLRKKDLEEIRIAAIAFFKNSKHELKEKFIKELTEGGIFIGAERFKNGEFSDIERSKIDKYGRIQKEKVIIIEGDMVSIGAWRLENDDEDWTLKRYGEHRVNATAQFNFGVCLQRNDNGWRVTRDYYEHGRTVSK